jgi:AcrR family transcriptional regulator
MSPKPNVSNQRTAQIIEAATTVFAAKGFDHATMDDIADQAGINKATIYLYFDSKDALIRAVAGALFARELADLQAAMPSSLKVCTGKSLTTDSWSLTKRAARCGSLQTRR